MRTPKPGAGAWGEACESRSCFTCLCPSWGGGMKDPLGTPLPPGPVKAQAWEPSEASEAPAQETDTLTSLPLVY